MATVIAAYRNVHSGRSAVLFLSGPTLAKFGEPEPDLITCGVNTVLFHRPNLDYYFIQDVGKGAHKNSYVNRKAEYDAFKPRIAKFYGNTLCKSLTGGGSIPYQFTHAPIIKQGRAKIEDPKVPADFSADLANKPPAAAGSVAFPALQFLLWTGVKKIYIVGADIKDGRRIGEKPTQDYVKQNHLGRWQEFEKWVGKAYPDVEIEPVNPVGLQGMFSLRKKATFVAPKLYDPFRFHVLGIPHTVTSKEFAHCAYTQKVRRFCKFMTEAGHTVYHYGHERSEVICTEHITVSNDRTIRKYADWKKKSYNGNLNDECNKQFSTNAIRELRKRIQLRDFVLCWYGRGHQRIAKAFPKSIVVEPSIGTFRSFAEFRIFESYALMHNIYGAQNIKPNWYDAVIPGFLPPEEFTYSAEKEDWFLYLGRLQPLKGIDTALNIARRTGCKLKVAGQGTLDKVPPNVELVGYADMDMKADLLSRAKALIAPSRYCEPFGYTAIEAAMSGTPVICPDWGGFTETVQHGLTGWRCRTMDQFDWAVRNIGKIKPELCRAWAMANYTTERARARYEEYFRQLRGVFFGCDFKGSDPERVAIAGPTRTPPAVPASVNEVVAAPVKNVPVPSTTLLLPTHNRNELLEFGLQSARAHKFPGELEILVLDEGDDDTAAAVAKKWGAKYVRTRTKGDNVWRVPGFAFNIGAKMAKGEVLVLSCPEILHLGPCLKELAEQVASNPNALAIPQGRGDHGTALEALKAGKRPDYNCTEMYELNTKLPFLLALRKDTYIEVGGYDEDFTGRCYDDNDFVDRLMVRGMEYKYIRSRIIHLYHSRATRNSPNDRARVMLNKQLWQERKGQIVRNAGREWGVRGIETITPLEVYQAQFSVPQYNKSGAPANHTYAIEQLPESGTLIDVGTGRANFVRMLLRQSPNWEVTTCDLAKFHVLDVPFVPIDLTTESGRAAVAAMRAEYLTCLGVLEHLPEAAIPPAIEALSQVPEQLAVITAANHSDIGVKGELHLTQQPVEWWQEQLGKWFTVTDTMKYAGTRGFCFTVRPK